MGGGEEVGEGFVQPALASQIQRFKSSCTRSHQITVDPRASLHSHSMPSPQRVPQLQSQGHLSDRRAGCCSGELEEVQWVPVHVSTVGGPFIEWVRYVVRPLQLLQLKRKKPHI